jgi:hypothetical protein
MKSIFKGAVVFALLALILAGCELPSQPADTAATAEVGRWAVLGTGVSGPFLDASGQIVTKIHWAYTNGQHNTINASIDSDEVLVGGGAYVDYSGYGAVLTGSFPALDANGYGTGWTAQSKDHLAVCQHNTYAYAVGMKVKASPNGAYMPRSLLQQYIRIFSVTSAYSPAPQATVDLSSNWDLLSGGAQVLYPFGEDGVNVCGNLLTRSVIKGNGWYAESRELGYASPARITVWAIAMTANDPSRPGTGYIPGWGHIQMTYRGGATTTSAYYPGQYVIYKDAGNCITGVGASTGSSGTGRFLTMAAVSTDNSYIIVRDKDHCYPAGGGLSAYLCEIVKID